MSDFTVFVSNHAVLDKVPYELWLLGLTVDQGLTFIRQRANTMLTTTMSQPSSPTTKSTTMQRTTSIPTSTTSILSKTVFAETAPILKNYLLTQYRNFEILEHYLHRPRYLSRQLLFPLDTETKDYVIESYYSFDERVIREILGKKLNSRSRKELDDVCEKTKVPIGACRRMFDNLKRIMKKVEDAEGNIVRIIENEFCLPTDLARKYAHTIFITTHRLDTTKKKLSHLRFSDFEYCASQFIQHLTIRGGGIVAGNTALLSNNTNTNTPVPSSAYADDFDPILSQDARDLKGLLFNNKDVLEEYRLAVLNYIVLGAINTVTGVASSSRPGTPSMNTGNVLSPSVTSNLSTPVSPAIFTPDSEITSAGIIPPPPTTQPSQPMHLPQQVFKSFLRSFLTLGITLTHSKDVRDIFVNLLEKLVEPLMNLGWTERELETFMEALIAVWPKISSTPNNNNSLAASQPNIQIHVGSNWNALLKNLTHRKRYEKSLWRLVNGFRGPCVRLMAATRGGGEEN